jgi:hypothetical protein
MMFMAELWRGDPGASRDRLVRISIVTGRIPVDNCWTVAQIVFSACAGCDIDGRCEVVQVTADRGSSVMLRRLMFPVALSFMAVCSAFAQKAPPPATAQPAAPAKTPTAADAPMQVFLVRSGPPGCEPHCTEWIAAQGQIDKDTPAQFKKVFAQLGNRRVPILIHSGGGTVDDAIAIGRLIRTKGFDVAVTKTEFAPCAPADTACRKKTAKGGLIGTPKARMSYCASACAFILAGGVRRYVGPWTVLGVHQITSFQKHVKLLRTYQITTRRVWGAPVEVKRTLVGEKTIAEKTVQTQTKSSTYESVRQHFVAMGVDESIMPLLMAAPGTTIRWLTRAELGQTRIATEISLTGEQLIAAAFPPKPEPVAMSEPAAPPASAPTTDVATMPAASAAAAGPLADAAEPAPAPPAATAKPAEVAKPAAATPAEVVRPRKADKPRRPAVAPAAASASPAYDFSRSNR